jgi:hypothetical protein
MQQRPTGAFGRSVLPACRVAFFVLGLVAAREVAAHAFDPAVALFEEIGAGRFTVQWRLAPGSEARPVLELPEHCTPRTVSAPATTVLDCSPHGLRGFEIGFPSGFTGREDVFLRVSFASGDVQMASVHRDRPAWLIPAAPDGPWLAVATRYFWLGIEHILLGLDHLLFVLGLLLLVPHLRLLIATLTAFTIAHSITLALATLDVLRVAPAPVEALIAASIVLIAHELTRDPAAPPTLTRRRPWLVAFAFGLLHGLGFAGALREIGLPSGQLPLALLAFNLGVEAGQLLFVALLLWPARRWHSAAAGSTPIRLVPAYLIGAIAVSWVIERATNLLG